MTGFPVEVVELSLLVLTIAMLVLSYLYRRTKKDAYNLAFILTALLKTEVMKARDRRKARDAAED